MLRCAFGITALCALGASAFLLPPGVAPAKDDSLTASVLDPTSYTITLPCPECGPLYKNEEEKSEQEDKAEGKDDLYWTQDEPLELELDFTISEDARRLELGGGSLYPLPVDPEGVQPERFHVALKKREAALDNAGNTLEISASALNIDAQPVSDNGDTILTELTLTFQIFVVNEHPVTVNSVELTLLQTGTGELLIMDARAHDEPADFFPPPPPHSVARPQKQCDNLPAPLCRLKNMVESKVAGLRHGKSGGCRGSREGHFKQMPGHIKGPHFPGMESPDHGDREGHPHGPPPPPPHGRPHHGRPHHGPPHGPHGRHGRHGPHFLHSFVKGFIAVLIPIMTGIAFGFVAAAIGSLIGRLIAFLWIKFVRGGQRGYASVAQEEAADVEDADVKVVSEKNGIDVAEMEAPPPVYQDAPAYEEVEKEVK